MHEFKQEFVKEILRRSKDIKQGKTHSLEQVTKTKRKKRKKAKSFSQLFDEVIASNRPALVELAKH
ncbi:hypothetical protein H0O03_04725 [Candidatus Micrarchaeota archaeon]|nr:hypothetical protein [Candidatus Micrarchaeota archaeon]